MATGATLLPLLRNSTTPTAIRPAMLLRVMDVLRQQATRTEQGQEAAGGEASAVAAATSASSCAGRAELLQLDAPAVLLHVMQLYTEGDSAAAGPEEKEQEPAGADQQPQDSSHPSHAESPYLQVQLACMDVMALLASDAAARASWLPRLSLPLAAALHRALDSYAPAQAPGHAPVVSVDLVASCLPLVSVMLSEKGSGAMFAHQGAFFARVAGAFMDACAHAQGASDAVVERLHSAGLTCLLLLLQHQLDQLELPMPPPPPAADCAPAGQAAPSSSAASDRDRDHLSVLQVLCSHRMVQTVFVRVATAMLDARSDSTAPAQALRWKFCALAARFPQLFQHDDDDALDASSSASDQPVSDSASSNTSDPLRSHAGALATSLIQLLAGSTAAYHAYAAWEPQALTALHTLCVRYRPEVAESACTKEGCETLLHLLRTRADQVDVQQGVLRVMHGLLRSGQRSHDLSHAMRLLSVAAPAGPALLPSSSARDAASSSNQSTGDAPLSHASLLLLQLGVLPQLISTVETTLAAAPRTHVEADAWLDVQSMALYAAAALFLADAQRGDANADADSKGHSDKALDAVERLLPLALRCLRSLAQSAACSSSDLHALGSAPSLASSAHQAVSSLLFVLGGERSSADRLLASGAVPAALRCVEECVTEGLDPSGETVARPCLVLLLRLGAHASPERSAATFAPCASDAMRALQPLFDDLPASSSLGDVVADALLMLQGKAPPPPQYRS